MADGLLLQWGSPCCSHRNPLATPSLHFNSMCISSNKRINRSPLIRASVDSAVTTEEQQQQQQQLTAKDRRQLRNQRRESKSGYSWREEVEDRLSVKKKKKTTPKRDELSLDRLAQLGSQWWIIKVSKLRGHETAEVVAKLLSRNYPEYEFKIYAPCLKEKRHLKSGKISVKQKPTVPGCAFLRCVLNKEIHDFVSELDGVGGFIGAKIKYMGRSYNIPRHVDEDDMEKIFKQSKEEQEKHDQAFEEEQQARLEESLKKLDGNNAVKSGTNSKLKKNKPLAAGSAVRVQSGTFSEFEGRIKKVNRKAGKATVGFTLFGKETSVELELHEIVAVAA